MCVRRLWLCLPAIVLSAADGVLTLWGQPAEYWSGEVANVREYHPLPAGFLGIHPLDVFGCFESVLTLPLPKQAACVRLAAEASLPVWREWCRQRGVNDLSVELLECFDRWLVGTANDEVLSETANRLGESLPQDLRKEREPAGA